VRHGRRRRPDCGLDIWEDDGGSWPILQRANAVPSELQVELKPIRIAASLRLRPRLGRLVTRLVITTSPEPCWIWLPDRRLTALFVFHAAMTMAALAIVGLVASNYAGMAMAAAK